MRKILLVLASLACCMGPSIGRGEEYPTINLRFAHAFPPTVIFSKIDQWFADEIEKRSNGKIKIKIFWSEMLGKNTEILDLVGSGAVDMGTIVPSFFPTRLPLAGITNALPLAFDFRQQAQIITKRTRRKDSRDWG